MYIVSRRCLSPYNNVDFGVKLMTGNKVIYILVVMELKRK